MKKKLLLTLTLASAGVVLEAEPVNYWNVKHKGDILEKGNLMLDDGSVAAWTNGNWLIAGSTGYPAAIGTGYRSFSIGADVSAYGIKYKSGAGEWSGVGTLSVGEGGYDASSSWDDAHTFKMAGVRFFL